MNRFSISLLALLVAFPLAHAGTLDAASQQALAKTQQDLNDPQLRQKVVSQTPAAQTADAQANAVAGNPQNADQIYQISGNIFAELVQKTGGDVTKLMEIMSKATSDPKGFYESLSPSSRQTIDDLAQKISGEPGMAARVPASK